MRSSRCSAGVRESARANTFMVFVKSRSCCSSSSSGSPRSHGDNLSPFAPTASTASVDAAALIFFAYIGFDAVSTSGEEAETRPRPADRDRRSLVIATVLYILVAMVAVGARAGGARGLRGAAGDALRSAALALGRRPDSLGALIAITSVVLTVLYGQTRIVFAMCRDGLCRSSRS